MRVILCFLGVFYTSLTLGQQIDESIISSYPKNKQDSLYYELFKNLRQTDQKRAFSYAEKSYELAASYHHQLLELKALNAMGWLQQQALDFERAIATHKKALELAIQYKMEDRQMYSYGNLGIIYSGLDIYDKALENHFKALELARKLGVVDQEISSLNNIGVCYHSLKNYVDAINYYQQTHDLEVKNGFNAIDETYLNIGMTYIDLDDRQKAIEVFQDVLKRDKVDPSITFTAMRGLSRCYLLDKEFQKGIHFANKAIELGEANKITHYLPNAFLLKATGQYHEDNLSASLDNCEKARSIALKLRSHNDLEEIYALESQIYDKTGDYKKSKDALKLSVAYKDSIFNEKFTENFKNIHLKLEQDKNSTIMVEKDAKIARQQQYTLIFIGSGGFLLVITGISFYFFNVVRKKNKIIQANNLDLEHRVSERTKELQNVVYELDTYIYRTSHDIKGPLAQLKGLAELAILDRKNSEDYLGRLSGVIDKLNDIITRVQLISQIHNHQLSKSEIQIEELIDAAILSQSRNKNFGDVEITKHLRVKSIFTDSKMLSIAINNVISNAYQYVSSRKSSVLVIETEQVNDHVMISIMDNGVGFDPRLKEKVFEMFVHGEGDVVGAGLGLHLSKLAVEKTEGKIALVDGELTTIQLTIPA
jgi:signal transduction histidine kinase